MNILFITLLDIRSVDESGIYTDLIREMARNRHHIYVVSPIERKHRIETHLLEKALDEIHSHVHILKLKTGNIQKTNIIEKGFSTLLLEYQLLYGIKKYFKGVHFDLVLYSTPPITLVKPVKFIKKRDNAKAYLMLKDIFPQNAVDLGMMSTSGIKGLLYKYFRNKEKQLYALSDRIGCMSQANVNYIIKNNPEIDSQKVEICPNSIEVRDMTLLHDEKVALRRKYGIPTDKIVFVYGGNLGKPQNIPFIIECLKTQELNQDAFFLIVGDGTEYGKLEAYFDEYKPRNMKLMQFLPKDEYDKLVAACDMGLIYLDHRFTIPNFPSRLLGYMQVGLPVLACTDRNTDIGQIIVDSGFGWWCESNSASGFRENIKKISNADLDDISKNSYKYLKEHYSVERCYQVIMERV